MKKRIFLKIILLVLLSIVAIVGFGAAVYYIWEDAPEIETNPMVLSAPGPVAIYENESASEQQPMKEDIEGIPDNDRNNGVYTILFVGKDRVGNNTDTLLLARFDTICHTINVVSIPRDTYTNINWSGCRKINCIYGGAENMKLDPGPIDRLKLEISRLSGITPDCYVVLNLNTFIEAVDMIGGINYNVPFDMDYDDFNQDLHIHISAGFQTLNGYSAMGLWRFRSGFVNGDLGRLDNQHQFLRAVADQFLSLGTIPHLNELISLVAENTETNLTSANFAWLARQFFKCSSEDINFFSMPNIATSARGYSYVFPLLDAWLEMINSSLNPYSHEITREDLDCICIDPEDCSYFPTGSNFIDPRYLAARRYYPENIAKEEAKAVSEAEKNETEDGKSSGSNP